MIPTVDSLRPETISATGSSAAASEDARELADVNLRGAAESAGRQATRHGFNTEVGCIEHLDEQRAGSAPPRRNAYVTSPLSGRSLRILSRGA